MVKFNNNNSIAGTAESDYPPDELFVSRIIIPIIYTLIVIIGLIGNSLVIYVVIKSKKYLRSRVYVYIIHLAFCDLCFLLFCLPVHTVIFVHDTWPFGDVACRLVHFIMFMTMHTSAFLGLSISIDRYLATSSSIWVARNKPQLKTQLICGTVWLASIIISSPWLNYYQLKTYSFKVEENVSASWNTPINICTYAFPTSEAEVAMVLSMTLLGYVVPAVFIILFSVLLIIRLWILRQPDENMVHLRRKKQVTILVTATIFIFLICWLPYHCCVMFYIFAPQVVAKNIVFFIYIRMAAHAISYANSCINPVIYNFLSKNFQRDFAKIFRRPCQPPIVTRYQFYQRPQELIEFRNYYMQ